MHCVPVPRCLDGWCRVHPQRHHQWLRGSFHRKVSIKARWFADPCAWPAPAHRSFQSVYASTVAISFVLIHVMISNGQVRSITLDFATSTRPSPSPPVSQGSNPMRDIHGSLRTYPTCQAQ